MLSSKKFKFKLSPSSQTQSSWKEIPGVGRILHGTFSQSEILSNFSGTQCAAASVAAIAYSQVVPVEYWTASTIDEIIIEGTRRHEKCNEKDDRGYADVRQFFSQYVFETHGKQVYLQEGTGIAAIIQYYESLSFVPLAQEVFTEFIDRKENFCFVFNAFTLAVIMEQENVYLFNSHATGETGEPCDFGRSCCVKMPITGAGDVIINIMRTNYFPEDLAAVKPANYTFCITGVKAQVRKVFQASAIARKPAITSGRTNNDFVMEN